MLAWLHGNEAITLIKTCDDDDSRYYIYMSRDVHLAFCFTSHQAFLLLLTTDISIDRSRVQFQSKCINTKKMQDFVIPIKWPILVGSHLKRSSVWSTSLHPVSQSGGQSSGLVLLWYLASETRRFCPNFRPCASVSHDLITFFFVILTLASWRYQSALVALNVVFIVNVIRDGRPHHCPALPCPNRYTHRSPRFNLVRHCSPPITFLQSLIFRGRTSIATTRKSGALPKAWSDLVGIKSKKKNRVYKSLFMGTSPRSKTEYNRAIYAVACLVSTEFYCRHWAEAT